MQMDKINEILSSLPLQEQQKIVLALMWDCFDILHYDLNGEVTISSDFTYQNGKVVSVEDIEDEG